MPIRGDHAALRRFSREMAQAAAGQGPVAQAVMAQVKTALQDRIKGQFQTGDSASDRKHKPRADGKPALVSRRLGNAARARVTGGSVWVEPKTRHVADILDTQQEGHVYAARTGRVVQHRDKHGRLIGFGKFQRLVRDATRADLSSGASHQAVFVRIGKRGGMTWKASRSVTRGVKFGRRVLDPREIRPRKALTDPWQQAIGRAFEAGFRLTVGKYQ